MSIRKNISLTFVSQIINTAIGVVSSIIVSRLLGTEGRGDLALFTTSVSFAVLFFGFSISSTIPYFINSGKAKPEELLSTIILFVLSSTLLVYGTLELLGYADKLNWVLPAGANSFSFKIIFILIYLNTLFASVATTFLTTYKKFREVAVYTVVFQLVPTIIYLLTYFRVFNYTQQNPFQTVLYIMLSVSILSFIAVVFLFLRYIPARPGRKIISIGMVKQFVFFSSLAYIGNVATFFNYKLDFWVVDAYWGKPNLGIYSLASQLTQMLWMLPQAIAAVLYSYASSSSEEDAVKFTIPLKQIGFYGTLVLGAIGLALAYYLIPVLYGAAFFPAFHLMKIFILGVIPFSLPTIVASLFAARGNFKISFIVSVGVFAISACMYFILIPRFGLIGGAVSSAIAYFIAAIACELWFCKEYNVSLNNLFKIDKTVFSISAIKSMIKK